MGVIVAGTFEYLHAGHRALIDKALSLGKPVVIGLTTDRYANSKRTRTVKPYGVRWEQLMNYLHDKNALDVLIFPVDDPISGAFKHEYTDIVVSPETVVGAMKVNEARKSLLVPPLTIHVVEFALAADGQPISSTRISKGECKDENR